jgi:hypothetical protein
MRSTLSILFFVVVIGVGSFAMGQEVIKPAADTYSYYTRTTDRPGTLTFFTKTDGRVYIKAQDSYGARIVGLKNGYGNEDIVSLINFIRTSSLGCTVLLPLTIVGGWLSTLPQLAAGTPIIYSLGKGCDEESNIKDRGGFQAVEGYVNSRRDSSEYPMSLSAKNYWNLYDAIEGHSSAQSRASFDLGSPRSK